MLHTTLPELPEPDLNQRDTLHRQGLAALAAGERGEAKRVLAQALLENPLDALSHAHLAYVLLGEHDLEAAHILYSKAIELDAHLASAYHGLAQVHEKMGDSSGAALQRARGLRLRPITTHRYQGCGTPIEVLLLGAQGSTNIDTKHFFDPQLFRVHALAVEYFPLGQPLPAVDFCFNAIGEADSAHASLLLAKEILTSYRGRIFNHPDVVLRTGRIAVAQLLRGITGVRTPQMVQIARRELAPQQLAETMERYGLSYPFLLRTPGQHTGLQFMQIQTAQDVAVALESLPHKEFLAIEFLDARSVDGLVRKYRVIVIDGVLYPIHLAISSEWKVHYFSGKTDQLIVHRAEEERFLESMPLALGPAHLARLQGIARLLALDYGGIDFSIARDGSLVVFEANANMGFCLPPPTTQAAYRRPAIERAQRALGKMLMG